MTGPAWLNRMLPPAEKVVEIASLEASQAKALVVLDPAERDQTLKLMRYLARRGIVLALDSDGQAQVVIDSGRAVPPDLKGRIDEHKESIVALLKAQHRAAERLAELPEIALERRSVKLETIWGPLKIIPERSDEPKCAEITWTELHQDPWQALKRVHLMAATLDLFEGKLTCPN